MSNNMFRALQKWHKTPSDGILKKMAKGGIFGLFFSLILMSIFFFLAGTYPHLVLFSQICFSKQFLVNLYENANLFYYRIGQIVDYGFMVSVAFSLFAGCILKAREFSENSKSQQLLFICALLGLILIGCDAFENVFILLTLQDPINFPSILAILQSSFSLIKWILLVLINLIILEISISTKRKKNKDKDCENNLT
ncbi:MAG: hypothetical protein GF364_11305 [Candidatus Lokiarchaeota archaeon]|nr:hypothetical protein [Candidatus Lokiarchaeota archaeon]